MKFYSVNLETLNIISYGLNSLYSYWNVRMSEFYSFIYFPSIYTFNIRLDISGKLSNNFGTHIRPHIVI